MPRGDKSVCTAKQDRKADHIAESYEHRGVPAKEAERRAWATVNKDDGGGKKSGSGRGTGHRSSSLACRRCGIRRSQRRRPCWLGQEGRGNAQAQRCLDLIGRRHDSPLGRCRAF